MNMCMLTLSFDISYARNLWFLSSCDDVTEVIEWLKFSGGLPDSNAIIHFLSGRSSVPDSFYSPL